MHRVEPKPLHIEYATTDNRGDALLLALSHLPEHDRSRHLAAWNRSLESGKAQLFVADRGGRVAAAMLVERQPGRTAVLQPPRWQAGESRVAGGQLISRAVADLAGRGVQLAQALLETDHGIDAEVLGQAGFVHASDLLYLVSLAGTFPTSRPQDGLEFVPYTDEKLGRLAAIVEQTYHQTRDFPDLGNVRKIDDVLDGYRAVGDFDPGLWFIARDPTSDVGCLLLARGPAKNTYELVYMGILPSARGRGFGVALVRHAQWLAARVACERLTTAVDADNAPAISVYAAAGFTCWDRRSVYLRVLS